MRFLTSLKELLYVVNMSNGCAETNEMELAQKGFINLDFCVRLSTAILQMLTPTTVSIIRDRNEGNHYLEIRSTSSRAVSLYLIIKVRKPDLCANLNAADTSDRNRRYT